MQNKPHLYIMSRPSPELNQLLRNASGPEIQFSSGSYQATRNGRSVSSRGCSGVWHGKTRTVRSVHTFSSRLCCPLRRPSPMGPRAWVRLRRFSTCPIGDPAVEHTLYPPKSTAGADQRTHSILELSGNVTRDAKNNTVRLDMKAARNVRTALGSLHLRDLCWVCRRQTRRPSSALSGIEGHPAARFRCQTAIRAVNARTLCSSRQEAEHTTPSPNP